MDRLKCSLTSCPPGSTTSDYCECWIPHETAKDRSLPLQGSLFESFGEYGPRLFPLPLDRNLAEVGLKRVISLDAQAPAVSIIASAAAHSELAQVFAYLAEVQIDGDLPVHCRFADTRVLPQLLQVLSPQQALRLSTSVKAWSWIDHHGAVGRWSFSNASPDADSSHNLRLTEQQFEAMLDASEPDTMFLLLLENTPELVPELRRGHFRDQLSRTLGRADMRRLVSPNDRFQFVVLSLSCGESFDDHPALQTGWGAISERNTTLVDEMKNWSESLWDQLQNRQPSATTP